MIHTPSQYCTCKKFQEELKSEKETGYYCPEHGFYKKVDNGWEKI